MSINPLDILLVAFLIITALIGFKNGIIIESKKTASLIGSVVLSNIVIKQLANKFYFLKSGVDIFYLSTFLIIFIIIILTISFLIDMIIEESDEFIIDKYTNISVGALIGIIRGAFTISLILYIFDTTPIDQASKESIYNKIQGKSILFEKFNSLKDVILKK